MGFSISVVIPAHNAGLYIGEALDSVANQRRRPDRIVVVDDGSTDSTTHKVREWALRREIDVRLLCQENRGVAAARNTGIRHANTDLVALLDADDLLLPHHTETLSRPFERGENIVLCFGDGEVFDSSGVIQRSILSGTRLGALSYTEGLDGLRICSQSAYSSLLRASYIPTAGTMFVRQAAEAIGLYDETLKVTEDRDFYLRMSRIGVFGYYDLIVCHKRSHDCNLTHASHAEGNKRYQLMVLNKMMSLRAKLYLSRVEAAQTQEAIRCQAWDMLYSASRRGVRAYLDTWTYLLRHGPVLPLLNVKHCLRSLVCSCYRGGQS